jgi:hypothetical protein
MSNEKLDVLDRGKSKFASELVLWLLAAAMAIVLVLVEKTPGWTAILLIALAAFISYPIMQLPGVRKSRTRQIATLPVTVCATMIFGFLVWPKKGSSESRGFMGFPGALRYLEWLLDNAWIQRALLIALGMILLALFQRTAVKVSAKRKRAATPPNVEKGFLDHKMQAEDSMQKLLPILARVTKIIADVGKAMDKQAGRIIASTTGKTRTQIEVARATANMLNKYSKKLDHECVELEQVGSSIAEGTYGWLRWVSIQESSRAAAQVIRSNAGSD